MNENFAKGLATTLAMPKGKVRGNKNWVIKTYGNEIICGRPSHFFHGFFSELLTDIGKYNITWRYYTYKKDFEAAIADFEKLGYKVYWGN
jgi:hypothetical protein